MATISFGGLGNGFDFSQVVNQLVAVQQQPITQLSDNQKSLQDKLTAYGTLNDDLLKLQTAATALNQGSNFDHSAVAVDNDGILTASGDSTAAPGSYTLQVRQLARANQVINKAATAVASTTSSIVSGPSATFSFTVGNGTQQSVTLDQGATLDDLKTAINDLGAGVSASILNTGTDAAPAYRLVLTATNTGAANAVSITADGTSLDFANTSGSGGTDTLQAAQDAIVILGDPNQTPITLQRSTNTITDAISGVTLNLKSTTAAGSTVNVAVSRDTDTTKSDIKAIVSAYNDIVTFINQNTTYDTNTQQGGTLFSEGTPQTVLSRLHDALMNDVGGLTGMTSAAEIGFQTQRDGTITVDDATLDQALSQNYTAVRNLFINQAGSSGVAQRLSDAVDALDDVESGALTLRKSSLTTQISDLSDQIAQKQEALSQYQQQLQLQYAALDSSLREMQTQMSYLSSLSQ
jgi:flagellar hook-associated protein 2